MNNNWHENGVRTTAQCIFQSKNQGTLKEADVWQVHKQNTLLTICFPMNFHAQAPAKDLRNIMCSKNWTHFLD